jgi:hypothetical protein
MIRTRFDRFTDPLVYTPGDNEWRYGVTRPAAGLERITVDGSDNNKDWLKVTTNRPGAASTLRSERVPYTG